MMEAVQQKVAAVGDGGLLGRVCCLWRSIAARQCCSGKLSSWAWHWVGAAVCFRGPPASRLQPELWAVLCPLIPRETKCSVGLNGLSCSLLLCFTAFVFSVLCGNAHCGICHKNGSYLWPCIQNAGEGGRKIMGLAFPYHLR